MTLWKKRPTKKLLAQKKATRVKNWKKKHPDRVQLHKETERIKLREESEIRWKNRLEEPLFCAECGRRILIRTRYGKLRKYCDDECAKAVNNRNAKRWQKENPEKAKKIRSKCEAKRKKLIAAGIITPSIKKSLPKKESNQQKKPTIYVDKKNDVFQLQKLWRR